MTGQARHLDGHHLRHHRRPARSSKRRAASSSSTASSADGRESMPRRRRSGRASSTPAGRRGAAAAGPARRPRRGCPRPATVTTSHVARCSSAASCWLEPPRPRWASARSSRRPGCRVLGGRNGCLSGAGRSSRGRDRLEEAHLLGHRVDQAQAGRGQRHGQWQARDSHRRCPGPGWPARRGAASRSSSTALSESRTCSRAMASGVRMAVRLMCSFQASSRRAWASMAASRRGRQASRPSAAVPRPGSSRIPRPAPAGRRRPWAAPPALAGRAGGPALALGHRGRVRVGSDERVPPAVVGAGRPRGVATPDAGACAPTTVRSCAIRPVSDTGFPASRTGRQYPYLVALPAACGPGGAGRAVSVPAARPRRRGYPRYAASRNGFVDNQDTRTAVALSLRSRRWSGLTVPDGPCSGARPP